MMKTSGLVSEKQKTQFTEEGYMNLAGIIPADLLTMLREECSYFLGYLDGQMDAGQKTVSGGTVRGQRYFIHNRYPLSSRLWQFIFSPLMAEVTQAALGPNVYLLSEQWVVKGAEHGMKFGWHQDSGYLQGPDQRTHQAFLTCWCTLDEVNEANGTVYLLPHSRGKTRETIVAHIPETGTGDLIGYTGSDPGIPVLAPAGSVAAFSSFTLHRSGANTTPRMRRVYVVQYSREPIYSGDGQLRIWAVPFVQAGKIVYDRSNDPARGPGQGPEK